MSIKHPTWTGLGFNLVLSVKSLESIQMGDGMDVHLSGISVMVLILLVSIEMNCQ